jgi:hypothetical protein
LNAVRNHSDVEPELQLVRRQQLLLDEDFAQAGFLQFCQLRSELLKFRLS